MKSINLVLTASGELRLTKANANYVCAIPYVMSEYTELLEYCQPTIPPEWQVGISDLLKEERMIIEKRQAIMASYKAALGDILPLVINDFFTEYPELIV